MSNCKYETSNGRCGLKGSYAYRHKCYTEDMCRCHEPKTNADHIRSMTDEELMEVLGLIARADCCINPTCDVCTSCVFYSFCQNKTADDVLEWLKLPYKEDT